MKKIGTIKIRTSLEVEKSFMGIGFETLDREMFRPEMCYGHLAKTGAKFARCQTGWFRCEKEKGVYDFAWLDEVVDNLLAIGVKPWFNVGYGNPVYMDDISNEYAVGCVPLYYGEEALQGWRNYVFALAEHFKGRVDEYEIWNEPDLDGHWFWYPAERNAKDYAMLVRLSGNIIREIIPEAKIGMNIAHVSNLEYTAEVANHLSHGDIDFVTYHYYNRLPEAPYFERDFPKFKNIFISRGFDVEFWQGETGFPSWSYSPHYIVYEGFESERAQAVWHLRHAIVDLSHGAKRYSLFQIADMWEKTYKTAASTIEKPVAHGILNGKVYTPKQSYTAFTRLSALLSGDVKPTERKFGGSVIDLHGDKNLWAYQQMCAKFLSFERNGKPFYVFYIPANVLNDEGEEQGLITWLPALIENPVVIDTYTGEVFDVSENKQKDLHSYKNLVIRDYPMIICDKTVFDIDE